jgi:two-component system CheB/CheR fusion protein
VDIVYQDVNPAAMRMLKGVVNGSRQSEVGPYEPYWREILGEVAVTGRARREQRYAEHARAWYDFFAFKPPSAGSREFALIFRDVTVSKRAEDALRENEERLRLIVENAREFAIFSTDLQRRVTSWNLGAERLLGFTEAEIVGKIADVIFTEQDRAAGAPEHEASRAMQHGRAADERWHSRKDGSRFWGSGFLMAMHDRLGAVIGFVKILHDRTKPKQAEEALAQSRARLEAALKETEGARQEAEAAGRTKDHFLATLSHELRTPLTPVLITAESLLRRNDLPSRAVDGLRMICRDIEIETHFIDDLLDLTRITRGKFEMAREPLDTLEAMRAALQICEPDITAKAQKLTVELEAEKKEILGDFTRVQQVFWNLLKNASKFTESGGQIRVTAQNEPGWIVVSVSDTGIGIPQGALPEIFTPFRQADTSITRRFGGLGLGLAIAKATVEALGGNLAAASDGPGRGSSFTVRFPLHQSVVSSLGGDERQP